jgi:hypothetical protein
MGRLLRLADEHGLGQVELAGNPLHRGRVQSFAVEYDRERISGERRVGEDVVNLVSALNQTVISGSGAFRYIMGETGVENPMSRHDFP